MLFNNTLRVLGLAIALSVCLLSCDDDPATGSASCVVDADCEGLLVCSGAVCTTPADQNTQNNGNSDTPDNSAPDNSSQNNNTDDPPDTGTPGDVGEDDVEETPDVPVMEDAPAMEDVAPGNLCEQAQAHIISCYPSVTPESLARGYNVQWPSCTDRDLCVAQCAVGLGCGSLACDFDPDIDCDSIGAFAQCIVDECTPLPQVTPCASDADCGSTYDCCGGRALCYHLNDAPDVCTLACTEPDLPDCLCIDDVCQTQPERTICEEAIEHLTGDCNYELDYIAQFQEDWTFIEPMSDGVCTPDLECKARCLAEPEDECFGCRYGPVDCLRDPTEECFAACDAAPVELCIDTGGLWGDGGCECCDGPVACGTDPESYCFDACCGPAQCYCPNDAPFWTEDRGCVAADMCP